MKRAGALAVVAAALAACARDPIPEPAAAPPGGYVPANGDAYVEASLGDASRLNPLLATDSASGNINGYVFNGLVKYDKDLRLIGDLAESFQVLRGGREILFALRSGVRWHDGAPFTSADVVFTYQRLVDPSVKTPFGADFEPVDRVVAQGPLTVRVLYKRPFAPALESWGMGILPAHVFAAGDFNTHPANRRPVGTGPYRFQEWRTDQKIVLVANDDYFEGRPRVDRVIVRVIPDSAVQFFELRNRSVDAMSLTPDQHEAYGTFFAAYNRFRYPAFSYTFFGFNMNRPMFADPRVRRALASAVDKREIIDGVLLGYGRPATGPFPPQSWAHDPEVPDTPYNPALARDLLAEAGWRDADGDGRLEKDGRPFQFVCITNQGNKTRELSAQILQAQFRKIGVGMDIRVIEWSSFIHDFVDRSNFDGIILGWNLGRDPDQYLIWHSSQRGEGRYNFVGYVNTDVDRLWEEGRREFDPGRRRRIYHRIHRRIANDLPYVFLYHPDSLPVVHKRFQNVEVAPAGLGWNFREWFVPAAYQKYRTPA